MLISGGCWKSHLHKSSIYFISALLFVASTPGNLSQTTLKWTAVHPCCRPRDPPQLFWHCFSISLTSARLASPLFFLLVTVVRLWGADSGNTRGSTHAALIYTHQGLQHVTPRQARAPQHLHTGKHRKSGIANQAATALKVIPWDGKRLSQRNQVAGIQLQPNVNQSLANSPAEGTQNLNECHLCLRKPFMWF